MVPMKKNTAVVFVEVYGDQKSLQPIRHNMEMIDNLKA